VLVTRCPARHRHRHRHRHRYRHIQRTALPMLIPGDAPFIWQQMALLEAEKAMRFEHQHEDDFMNRKWEKWANQRFDAWLDDGRNKKFKTMYDGESNGSKVGRALTPPLHVLTVH